jgi:cytochrome c553
MSLTSCLAGSRRGFVAALLAVALTQTTRADEPLWAYGFVKPAAPGEKAAVPGGPSRTLRKDEDPAEQNRKRQVPGSAGSYSLLEIRNGNDVVDWFPGDHPPMTPLMKNGPASLGSQAYGCAFCHLPNGRGKPENAPVAGLPIPYFVRQLQDMRKGTRGSADPRKANTLLMIALAKAMTDAEMKEAAEYFAALPWSPWIRVVETERVPRTKIVSGMFVPIEQERTEPLAGRIIEVPENAEQTDLLRNPHSSFIAYVPIGSVARGKELVMTGGGKVVDGKQVGGKTFACILCHGPDLNGLVEVPAIAGRSPSYLVRQLYDIQQGTRKSEQAQAMLPVVANLTNDDMVAIAAYIASLVP